jgi:hypothetical protein
MKTIYQTNDGETFSEEHVAMLHEASCNLAMQLQACIDDYHREHPKADAVEAICEMAKDTRACMILCDKFDQMYCAAKAADEADGE